MANYDDTLKKLEEMTKESKEAIKNANLLLKNLGEEMQIHLRKNFETLPKKLKEEIEKIENGGEIPQIVTTTHGDNFIYMEPSKSLSQSEKDKIISLERSRLLKMLNDVYKKITSHSNETIILETMPALNIRYKNEDIHIGVNTNEVTELATQINTLNNYVVRFEDDIKENTELANKQMNKTEIVKQAQETIKSTKKEEELLQKILHGEGITPAVGMSSRTTKDKGMDR